MTITNTKANVNLSVMNLEQLQEQILVEIRAGKSLLGQDGLLTPIIKQALEATLEDEMPSHLDENSANKNRCNGKSTKTVTHSAGSFELETSRDRNGSFEPEIVKKCQTVLNEALDEMILGSFGLGMSYDDIREH